MNKQDVMGDPEEEQDVMGDPEEEQKELQKMPTKTVTAVLIGAVTLLTGVQTVDMVTADAQADKIIEAYASDQREEAKCITSVADYQQMRFREINGKDTIYKNVMVKVPAGYKFNPLIYTTPQDTFEVTVRQTNKDSTLFVGRFASDTSSLLDVNVRLQPSKKPE